jgi:hydroxyethylthiazole kinase
MKEKLWSLVENVRKKSPLVHNITNYVVMNNTANALLALGASPVMAHAEDEVQDMVKIASSLVINIGTLSEKWVNAMKMALKQANMMKKPVVLDPVGAGATPYRNRVVAELLETGVFSAIRGNASEIMALVSATHRTKGVDSTHSSDSAVGAGQMLSREYGSIICVSGAVDYIISSKQIIKIMNGHPLMPRVTGMGCIATALVGAFIGIEENTLHAVTAAMAVMGIAGELAVSMSNGPGSLQMHFLDKLHNISREEFLATLRIDSENV